jgi:hypothetical protein
MAMSYSLRDLLALTIILSSGMAPAAFGAGPSQSELDAAGQSVSSWVMTNTSYDGHRYVNLIQITPSIKVRNRVSQFGLKTSAFN